MSAPNQQFREAEYLGWGYVAVTSSEILQRLLAGQAPDQDDKHYLERAKQFLSDAASGAKLVSMGVPSHVSPVETVRKFSYSVAPLRQVQGNGAGAPPDVAAALEAMIKSIDDALRNGRPEDPGLLTVTKDFFMQLHRVLLDIVESGKRRTGTDFTFGRSLFAQA